MMRANVRVGIVLAGLLTLAAAGHAQSAEVQLAFKNGASALSEGRSDVAEREFRTAVRLDPTLAEARLDLGLVLGREGKNAEAVESLRKALELNPKLDSANMFLGIFLHQAGHDNESAEALQREIALNPKSEEALSWLGIVELAAGRPELAVEPLDRAFALAPDDLNLLQYRGRAHSQVAQASYGRMAQISPDAWQVHQIRAELFGAESKDREAVAEYEAALARESRNPDLYEGLGDAYRRLNELEAAQKAYSRELELSPRNPIAMYNLGSTDVDRGDHAAGIPLLKAMLAAYRSSPTAEYYLGRGLAENGEDAEAVTWLEKSAHADPESEIAKRSYYELARSYRKLHRLDDAQRALATYNLMREKTETQKAARVADWRKLNGGAAAESTTASDAAGGPKP